MAGSVDSEKRRAWQRRMTRFKKSNLTVVRFCEQEGVSVPSFYAWRKRLQGGPAAANAKASDASPGSFRAVRLVSSPHVTVRLPGGTQFEIPGADSQVLQVAMETLAREDAQRIIAGGEPC